MNSYVATQGLRVHPALYKIVEETICPGTGVEAAYFWSCLQGLVAEFQPELQGLLDHRTALQAKIDDFYAQQKARGGLPLEPGQLTASVAFLREISYILPDGGPVSISTQSTDPEVSQIAAPQLVVPSDNARFVLNAVNARWGSLYDALYGSDMIPRVGEEGAGYNKARGDKVIEFANGLLDEIAPLVCGSWSAVTRLWPRYVGTTQQLSVQLTDGSLTGLRTPSLFVGTSGNLGPPDALLNSAEGSSALDKGRIFLKHQSLHIILEIDRDHPIGSTSLSGIKDVTLEAALTVILDMEDSVAAVDAEDKSVIYRNICHVMRGTLEASFVKNEKTLVRRMQGDHALRDPAGVSQTLPGRAVCLVRNVGHHMFTDAVMSDVGQVPEGFLDCLVTVVCALHDLQGTGCLSNSRTGSIYIVKPKMHGPSEVQLTSRIFSRVEEMFGLKRNTIKMGLMDEERRTSVNLRECLRACSERVFFINTGFLDRTGDEIHTCMHAGPVVPKTEMRKASWIKAYEASNVDVGLWSGLQGRGQIGKGMWAKPDNMKAMYEAKLQELLAGATTAWVPSPVAATIHSIHYHRCDVFARQTHLALRPPVQIEHLLEPPLQRESLSEEAKMLELRESAQSILGYVVRWVDLGVGCSKVPNLANEGLMEDRATLRISSQLLANWLRHGLINETQLREAFGEMGKIVDKQNAMEKSYRPMMDNPSESIAFQAALKLVLDGRAAPNGYTEPTLHEARRRVKAAATMKSSL